MNKFFFKKKNNMRHLLVIAIEQCQKAGLCASGAFDTTEANVVSHSLEVPEIPKEFLNPKCGPLANSRQLGRLEVCESKCREIAILGSEC